MPSPLGHALAGVAAGWLAAPPISPASSRSFRIQVAILSAVAVAPDLDLLIDRHSRETHSLGAAIIVATMAAFWRWPIAATRWRIWAAVFLAWVSHPLLDALAIDTAPPIGVMLFWPFSREHVQTGLAVFSPISRSWGQPGLVAHNAWAVVREVAILGPITGAVWWLRRRSVPAVPSLR
jgi:inner membrane protein